MMMILSVTAVTRSSHFQSLSLVNEDKHFRIGKKFNTELQDRQTQTYKRSLLQHERSMYSTLLFPDVGGRGTSLEVGGGICCRFAKVRAAN